ncbi:MAG TPA: DMT family transporter [Thermoanaerobaculia bacterium]|nr:DMT family transporter [Thermoanaerobaculia bacterium]
MPPHAGAVAARLQVIAAAFLFSTGGAVIKATSLSAWQVASFRSALAVLALPLLVPAVRRAIGSAWWRQAGWRIAAVGAAYGATLVLFVLGNKLTTAANTIFLQSTAPLYVLLVSPWLLGERITRRNLAFMATMAAGLALFFVRQRPPDELAPDPFTGNLLALAAGVTWAATLVGLRWLGTRSETGQGDVSALAVVIGNLFACLFALPPALAGTASLARAGWSDAFLVLFLGVVQVGLAYAFLTRAFRRVPAFEASLLLLVEPVLNPVWVWMIHGETPGAWALVGGAVILAATAVKTWLDLRSARRLRRRPAR